MFFTGKQEKKELLENSKLSGDTLSVFNKTFLYLQSSELFSSYLEMIFILENGCNDLFPFVQEHLTWSVIEALACLRNPALMVCLLMVYLSSFF